MELRACYARNPDPLLCGAARVNFTTSLSPLLAIIAGGNTIAGADPITLSADKSVDPEDHPDPFLFQWACQPPPAVAAVNTSAAAGAAAPCLDASGAAIALPSSASQSSWVLALMGSPAGMNYTISLTASKGDRNSTMSVFLIVRSAVGLPGPSRRPAVKPQALSPKL